MKIAWGGGFREDSGQYRKHEPMEHAVLRKGVLSRPKEVEHQYPIHVVSVVLTAFGAEPLPWLYRGKTEGDASVRE
jgi:hypothetical protein